jgi:ferredoxin
MDSTAFTVQLLRAGGEAQTFQAPADLPVLLAAERAGLRMESSCRNGTCRTCLRQLREGQVHYRIAWPGLSADEKREGYLLPCVAYAASDLVLEPQ